MPYRGGTFGGETACASAWALRSARVSVTQVSVVMGRGLLGISPLTSSRFAFSLKLHAGVIPRQEGPEERACAIFHFGYESIIA